jgi:hypothetical protein|tara:strand:- start:138 stop:272 length:135 start_codon:yes stop_codon:yes gene_type:complete
MMSKKELNQQIIDLKRYAEKAKIKLDLNRKEFQKIYEEIKIGLY